MTHVFTSSVVDHPIEVVWAAIRDFNGLPDWNPNVTASHIEDGRPSDAVGCVRNFTLVGGGKLREQLLALSDLDHSCTYSILESPMPLENYIATLRCLPITDGARTYVEWVADFDCPPEEEAGLIESIGQDVFQASFEALKSKL
ncbi:MAG: SRPBCC family protein [Planctomycetota bacterium]|nr:SRPBCC family protein [Planctomycetota bacterium]